MKYAGVVIGLLMGLQGCGGAGTATTTTQVLSDAAQLGELIFKDEALSASGQMSCATCHDPARGHASPFDTPVAFGGPRFNKDPSLTDTSAEAAGLRLPPAIGYLKFNTAFKFDTDGTPMGGFFWDGRVNTLAEQAQKPFLGANEMANASPQAVIDKLRTRPYADRFKQAFGANILDDAAQAFDRVAFALESYQKEDASFAPFSSKFDAVNAGKASFTEKALVENIKAFVDAVVKSKPAGSKGNYLKKISLSSTMGPGVSVDLSSATAN